MKRRGKIIKLNFKKRTTFLFFFSIVFILAIGAAPEQKLTYRFLTGKAAAEYFNFDDDFIRALSLFDRQARLLSRTPVSTSQFLAGYKKSLVDWKADEKRRMTALIQVMDSKIAPLNMNLPGTVYFIKSNGKDEGQHAYTRRQAIVIPDNYLKKSTDEKLLKILIHELFHVYSRYNEQLKDDLYKIIGFQPGLPLELPRELKDFRISNPDAPIDRWYLPVKMDGKNILVTPINYAKIGYDPSVNKIYSNYRILRFLVVERGENSMVASLKDGEPQLIHKYSVPGLTDKIGRNTKYINHPEEIMADNFALMVLGKRVPDPRITRALKKLIMEN